MEGETVDKKTAIQIGLIWIGIGIIGVLMQWDGIIGLATLGSIVLLLLLAVVFIRGFREYIQDLLTTSKEE
ncbi:hypothetical protein A3F38_03010 [Candidatus Saccharibacteria bacterium RIFCSPHIGHO2_12_FULL_48_21]|nr:MAG: hypothetical protein A3F38_03010 [Candidatus Saccharibacteria bacterium RIFCSPHIGHO2_12_FULL_48_21]